MGKHKKGKQESSSNGNGGGWSREEHVSRLHRRMQKEQKLQQEQEEEEDNTNNTSQNNKKKKHKPKVKTLQRSIHLSHDNYEKNEATKLRLHISKLSRTISKLKERLEQWDEVTEQFQYQAQLQAEAKKRQLELDAKKGIRPKKRGRLGPETWKLRGAARPAQEVYDFDVRYVDPHIKAHEEALKRAKRLINTFVVCKGHFGKQPPPSSLDSDSDDDDKKTINASATNNNHASSEYSELLLQTCREYLSSSMQYALLNMEAKKFKTARQTLLHLLDIEGHDTLHPITNARDRLMRMYLEANRPDSARSLWENKIPKADPSVWIRYSAALLEYVSWRVLQEENSTEETAMELLRDAIQSNVFCAYYIAFSTTFEGVFEYTEDVEDVNVNSDEDYGGRLMQAIEYCNSEQMGNWIGTEGAVEWLRGMIVQTLRNGTSSNVGNSDDDEGSLIRSDLEWEHKLEALEREYEETNQQQPEDHTKEAESNSTEGKKEDDGNNNSQDEEEEEADLIMFSGMFRTGMDILSDAGAFQ